VHKHHPPQQGVVLIVVLIMLVVIGFSSAAVMRNALNSDLVSANVRSETLATQAAQLALAHCEQQILLTTGSTVTTHEAATPARWQTLANWTAEGAAGPAKPDWAEHDNLAAQGALGQRPPECMAEKSSIEPSGRVVIVTARGFTPDYTENTTTGRVESGSTVWLQSTLRLSSP